MREFWLCFVPLFVAVDPIGILPVFLGLTRDVPRARVHLIIIESVLTAGAVSLLFLAGGTAVMRLLGITVPDFMIAGGIILFALSVMDLMTIRKGESRVMPEGIGAVPLGVPLIAGPAVLTTSVLLLGQYGFTPTALALAANVTLAGAFFWISGRLFRLLGGAGTTIVSKIASLLLAAIAVMMVRRGITEILAGLG